MTKKFIRSQARKPTRLRDFDYSSNGGYFVTICVQDRVHAFGEVVNGEMMLNEFGEITWDVWCKLPTHYTNCVLGDFVVMPNHIHGIVFIDNFVGEGFKPSPTGHGLSEIIRGLKTFSSRKINESKTLPDFRWQRSFHDRIIRNEKELEKISDYIKLNPQMWDDDEFNLTN